MKKLFCILFLTFSLNIGFSSPSQQLKEYNLENGLNVFLLKDESTPVIDITFLVRAGFSNQTIETAGFFKLFTRLTEKNLSKLNLQIAQCNSDASIYGFSTSPKSLERDLSIFSKEVFQGSFSDETLQEELNILKKEINNYAEDSSTLINAAIDSKVFSMAPWKHDSGIYPALFKKTSNTQARTILKKIGECFYTPSNSCIFIRGNIEYNNCLNIIKNTIGSYYSNYKNSLQIPSKGINNKRRFIIHSPDFSKEITQLVIQYTLLNQEETDLLSYSLNKNDSQFKNSVLNEKILNIPGNEYIDISSAHKAQSSRLIFQTLIQMPENKNIKTNPLNQSLEFLSHVKKAPEVLNQNDFEKAKLDLNSNLFSLLNNKETLIELLCNFWTIKPYTNYPQFETENLNEGLSLFLQNNEISSETLKSLLLRTQSIWELDYSNTCKNYLAEEPFIFVLMNSAEFKKYKKDFQNAKFEEITSNNASWYVQEMYKNIRDNFKPEDENITFSTKSEKNKGNNYYYEKNLSQIKNYKLKNNIKVLTKQNKESDSTCLLISIDGGKLNSQDNHGFEEVMISLLATNIQREINSRQEQGLIENHVNIKNQSNIATSFISLEFYPEDIDQVCEAISQGIVFGEILPAFADRALASRQYKKRLENGSAVNQMLYEAMRILYKDSGFTKIFEAKKEILETTNYTKILEGYPALLDSKRYSLIITGNFNEETILEKAETCLGILSPRNLKLGTNTKEINFPINKPANVKIVHTFLTDIPAEKAGPQPAVLIPTKEFLDPVIYGIKAPKVSDPDYAYFISLVNYLGHSINSEINKNSTIKDANCTTILPKANLDAAFIVVQNVSHIRDIETIYKKVINNLEKELSDTSTKESLIQKIKDFWILDQLTESKNNEGTAELIQKGFELCGNGTNGDFYLQTYNTIENSTAEDFIKILDYFPSKADLRLYSLDARN